MAKFTDDFVGLPIDDLIAGPIIASARAQGQLAQVYLDYVFKLAFKEGDPTKDSNIVSFNLERPVTDGAGNISSESVTVSAPLISLVPVPAFLMQETTVEFTMEVKSHTADTSKTEAEVGTEVSANYWGIHAKITGSVSTSREHTRTTDKSAKYNIQARAIQQAPSEGMAKLTQLFASFMEPIPVGGGGGGE